MLDLFIKFINESRNESNITSLDSLRDYIENGDDIYDVVENLIGLGESVVVDDYVLQDPVWWSDILLYNDHLIDEWIDFFISDRLYPLLNKELYNKDEISYDIVIDGLNNIFDDEINVEKYIDEEDIDYEYEDFDIDRKAIEQLLIKYWDEKLKNPSDIRGYIDDFVDYFIYDRQSDQIPKEIIKRIIDIIIQESILNEALHTMKYKSKTINGEECIYAERKLRFSDFNEMVKIIGNDVGIYWSWEEGHSNVYDGNLSGKLDITVKAYIPVSNINVERTIWVNLYSLAEEEKEVRIYEGVELYIFEIVFESNIGDIKLPELYDKLLSLYYPNKSDNYIERYRNKILNKYKEMGKDPWIPTEKSVLTFVSPIKSQA